MKKQKQKKQQSRVSDLASHPIRDTAHPIESRPNKNNGDVGEGSPFGDLHDSSHNFGKNFMSALVTLI